MKNFGRYLLLIFALLSIGGVSGYGNTLPEVRENVPFSSEDLRPANYSLFSLRENPFQEILDLSENHYFSTSSVVPSKFGAATATSEAIFLFYKRDLRRDISKQIFPKHFFL